MTPIQDTQEVCKELISKYYDISSDEFNLLSSKTIKTTKGHIFLFLFRLGLLLWIEHPNRWSDIEKLLLTDFNELLKQPSHEGHAKLYLEILRQFGEFIRIFSPVTITDIFMIRNMINNTKINNTVSELLIDDLDYVLDCHWFEKAMINYYFGDRSLI
jgi:hypothetical protein